MVLGYFMFKFSILFFKTLKKNIKNIEDLTLKIVLG